MSRNSPILCAVCRTANPPQARFCMQCGSTLAREVREPDPVPSLVRAGSHVPPPPRRERLVRLPLVGRTSELATLLQTSAAVESGIGRAVLIIGEAGIGKSRLIAEWKAALSGAEATRLRWVEARCRLAGREIGYHLLGELVSALLDLPASSDPATAAAALAQLADTTPDSAAVLPYLGHLLGLDHLLGTDAMLQRVEPRTLRSRYEFALQQVLLTLAHQTPLILVIDDTHWADPSSVDLLIRLIPLISEQSILLCVSMRAERESSGWRMVAALRELLGDTVIELALQPLNAAESLRLVAALLDLDDSNVPEGVRDLVLARADGNPYFMEEIVRVLIDQHVLVRAAAGWSLSGEPSSITIPATLHALLRARVDQLAPAVRDTIRVASVIGRQFSAPVLEHVLGQAHGVLHHLTTLERAGLITLVATRPHLQYRFRHALVQEAAYAALPEPEQVRLHLAVGEALEDLYPEQRRQRASALARHFAAGGDAPRAVAYAILAGQVALAAFANQEAEGHFRQALALAHRDAERATACAGLGSALARQSRYLEAITIWSEGIEYYYRQGDLDQMARLYALAARAASYDDNLTESLRLCQEGLARTSAAPEGAGLAALIHEAGRAYHFTGINEVAHRYSEQALGMAERLQAVDVQAEALTTLAIMPDEPPAQTMAWLQQAVTLAESNNLLQTAARAHFNLGVMIISQTHDFAGARYHVQRATELAAQQGIAAEEFKFRRMLVQFDTLAGDFDRAAANLNALRRLAMQGDSRTLFEQQIEIHECDLLNMRGLWEEATGRLRLLLTTIDPLHEQDLWVMAASYLVDALTEQGDYVAAEEIALQALQRDPSSIASDAMWLYFQLCSVYAAQRKLNLLQQTLHDMEQAKGHTYQNFLSAVTTPLVRGRIAAAWQQWDVALHLFGQAVAIAQEMGVQWWSARILLDIADALLARDTTGDLEQARTELDAATLAFDRLGAWGYVARTRERLASVRARLYTQARLLEEATRELSMAGVIQSGLLPMNLPEITGWEFDARLVPARETAGDFYDCIVLPDGRIGVVIADVAEKGAGAALYMALGRTLIRTYANVFPDAPEQVLAATNQHLLDDTAATLFITAFYGVLDPVTGLLLYCNAGHNPPCLFRARNNSVLLLERTGVLLGVTDEVQWHQAQTTIDTGDTLLCYTDGVTEARAEDGDFFGVDRLLRFAREQLPAPAASLNDAILHGVAAFAGAAPREDDMTLLVVRRTAGL